MRDVLQWALPTSAVLSFITLTTSIVSGMFPQVWSRGVPSMVLLVVSIVCLVLMRRGKLFASVVLLMSGISLVIFITLTFNGGVRAPAAMLLFFLVALCGWVFGRVAASVMAGISAVVVTIYFALGTLGVLAEPPLVPLVGEYVMLLVMTALIWGTSASPPSRMRSALMKGQIRERQLREEQAARLETAQRFQAVFDQTPHAVGLLTPDGKLETVNRGGLAFLGIRAEEVLGKPFPLTPWVPVEQRERMEHAIARAHKGVVRFELTHTDHKKRSRVIEVTLSPFRAPSGAVRFLIIEGRDVTELNLARERKQITQRLELVGKLAGGVAHDFNNVLMAILASTEVMRVELAAGQRDPKELEENLDTILEAGRRAGELTRRLLTFAQRGTLERRAVSVHTLLDSTVKLLERTLPVNIRLVVEAKATRDVVQGDAASLESALINLAINARDAMPNGGTVTFSTESVELDEEWCRGSGFDVKPGPYLRLSVKDTGVGIAPEHVTRVFEPFFTTKEEGKGTGLGLPSVFGVVRDHRGTVHVTSELGRGSEFLLSLPLSAAAQEAAPAPAPLLHFPGLRALVVDDELGIRKMLGRLLHSLEIEATQVASAEEALSAFTGQQLLITDVVLSGRRGNELAAELLAKNPALRALLISGFPKDSELSTLPADRVRMLAKPFTLETLQGAIAELIH